MNYYLCHAHEKKVYPYTKNRCKLRFYNGFYYSIENFDSFNRKIDSCLKQACSVLIANDGHEGVEL
jgi:hypothetical protein